MALAPVLHFHLSAYKRDLAQSGQGIWGQIAQAVSEAGWQINLCPKEEPAHAPGFHLVENLPILVPSCLTLRLCHMDPFWRIEASNDRWDWDIVHQDFVPSQGKEWFLKYWQDRLFKGLNISSQGHIFMPLQGRLSIRRHFQAQSPLEMIETTLKADPKRKILATLHPKESYSAEELEALSTFGPRFELRERPSLPLLASCDYVVTQNSAMAFTGYFARKPAVLFGEIDFHHIAGSVPRLGVEQAFRDVEKPKPFAAYLHWFLRENAISAWNDEAKLRIRDRFRRHGWPI
jgi:hypothetical protein